MGPSSSISGGGVLSVNGGRGSMNETLNGWKGGGGGGGRLSFISGSIFIFMIFIHFINVLLHQGGTEMFRGSMNAFGGVGRFNGGPGTVFTKTAIQVYGY